MRALVAGLLTAGLATTPAAAAGSDTTLRITYWKDSGAPPKSVTWTLRCTPPRGSLPRPVRACRKLARGGAALFAPLPPNIVCTEIYGGPQQARVTGVVRGKPVRATFSRVNGCEIGRWQRISPWLVPRGGVTG